MAFPFTEDTIINFLQKGVTQNQIDDTVSGNSNSAYTIKKKVFQSV